jgi:hypothetical protein
MEAAYPWHCKRELQKLFRTAWPGNKVQTIVQTQTYGTHKHDNTIC